MKEFVELFQVGDKTIIGLVVIDDEEDLSQISIVDCNNTEEGFDIDTDMIIIETPLLLLELISVSAIDQSQPVLQRQLKPFFGNPKQMSINPNSVDWCYLIEDKILINEYKNIVKQIYQNNNNKNQLN